LGACATAGPRAARATGPAYHRFWRGAKLASLDPAAFVAGLNRRFVPATVQVGAGKGLLAYEPLLPVVEAFLPGFPEEIALVTYEDSAAYAALRATPEGQAYAASHWEYFERAKSGSLVAEPF